MDAPGLREMVGWLDVLLSLGGVIVCALHLKRSPWMALLMGGFGLETLLSAFYRVAILAMGHGGVSSANLNVVSLFASLLGLVGRAAIVGGLAGLLSDGPRNPR